jgi:superoxide reductase
MKDLYQTADWKTEKHVPAIELPEDISKGEAMFVRVSVGKEVAHPNKTEHHIEWIELYFHPEGEKFPRLIGRSEFSAHGASADGADTSTVYAEPRTCFCMISEKSGTLHAASYCNIHGLWSETADLKL